MHQHVVRGTRPWLFNREANASAVQQAAFCTARHRSHVIDHKIVDAVRLSRHVFFLSKQAFCFTSEHEDSVVDDENEEKMQRQ